MRPGEDEGSGQGGMKAGGMKAAQQPPPGRAHPPRCLLSIRFFCRTGCSGMLSVMAAAGGAERGGMRFPAAPRSARHGSAGLGSARRGAGLAARRCRARSARPGSPRLASGLPPARFGPVRPRPAPAALRRPLPRPLGATTLGTAVPAAEAPPAGRGVGGAPSLRPPRTPLVQGPGTVTHAWQCSLLGPDPDFLCKSGQKLFRHVRSVCDFQFFCKKSPK